MNNIKPIETIYKGYRFRSRLEARWAVFFDAIGAQYEYEPEGFEMPDGTLYLPDFYLHGVRGRGGAPDIYVEIKGALSKEDIHKVQAFSEFYPVIIFGQIPKERWSNYLNAWDLDFTDMGSWIYNLCLSEGDDYYTEPKAGKYGGLVLDYPDDPYDYVDRARTIEAYRKARQARFEHGESPR